MLFNAGFWQAANHNWAVWFVTVALLLAAVIDGWTLKVPNWLTLPLVLSGCIHGAAAHGWTGLADSLLGAIAGLAILMPLYVVGCMGAGNIKLLAGAGAWLGAAVAFYSCCLSVVAGGAMVVTATIWRKRQYQAWITANDIVAADQPEPPADDDDDYDYDDEHDSSVLLLPYAIPLAIGAIVYFAWSGMLT